MSVPVGTRLPRPRLAPRLLLLPSRGCLRSSGSSIPCRDVLVGFLPVRV